MAPVHDAMRRVIQRQQEIRDELALPAGTLAEIRSGYRQKRRWWNDGGAAVSHRELQLAHPPVSVRYYGAEYAEQRAVVFAHGGGWIVGDSDTHDRLLRTISHICQLPVYSINYSLAPEAKHPTQIAEVARVINELAETIPSLVLMGDSCGATLMLQVFLALGGAIDVVGLSPNRVTTSAIAGLALFYGGYGLADSQSLREYGTAAWGMSRADLKSYEKAILPLGQSRENFELVKANLRGLPPTFVVGAECDPLRDDSRELAARLRAQNVQVRYHEVPGVLHAFLQYGRMLPDVDRVITNVALWITDQCARKNL